MGSLVEDAPVLTATADYPELCLEWLPTVGPGVADGEWCDITHYLAEGDTTAGRQYETDQFEAGTGTFMLRAPTRLFDQEYTAGPFYPWLLPMRQIRASAVWGGVRYPVWRGFIVDYGHTVPADTMFETTLRCEDGFYRLQWITLNFSAWSVTVRDDRPNVWYRFDDGDALIDASGNGNNGYWSGTPSFEAGAAVGDSSMGVTFVENCVGRGATTAVFSSADETFEFWFKTEATTGTLFYAHNNNLTYLFYLEAGKLRAWNSGTSFYEEITDSYNDGDWHHVAFTITDSTFYVDGVAVASTDASTTPAQISAGLSNGEMLIGDCPAGNDPFVGSLDELAIYESTLSAAEILAHYEAATDAWSGDTAGERAERILDEVGWPATLRNIETGVSVIGPFDGQGQTALTYLLALANTEAGMCFMAPDGDFTFLGRHYLLTETVATTAQATFGDAHSSATLKYVDAALPKDATLIRNPVIASRKDGVSITAQDAARIKVYGERTWPAPESLDSSDAVVRDRAYAFLARFKERRTRLARMVLKPRGITDLWPEALGRGFGDRIEIERTPLGTGNEIATEQHVERVAHHFVPKDWTTEMVGSPVSDGDEFVLDVSALDTGRLAY